MHEVYERNIQLFVTDMNKNLVVIELKNNTINGLVIFFEFFYYYYYFYIFLMLYIYILFYGWP